MNASTTARATRDMVKGRNALGCFSTATDSFRGSEGGLQRTVKHFATKSKEGGLR
jgi:hypothetical protein